MHFTFMLALIRGGKLRHSGYDFAKTREDVLKDLPHPLRKPRRRVKQWLMKNPYLRMLISEAAFVKNAFTTRGGHLSSGQPAICYIRIPRSASTAISKILLQTIYPSLKEKNLSATQVNAIADLNLRRTSATACGTTFTVVRNPFARIVSVYRAFFEKQDGYFLYEDYLFGIFRRGFSFEEFVKTLQVIPDRLKDQHLKPQHFFLRYYEQNNIPVNVLRLEDTAALEKFFGDHGLTFEEFNTSEDPYDFRQYYDPMTLQMVYRIYKADILRFGYEDQFRQLQFNIEHRAVHM